MAASRRSTWLAAGGDAVAPPLAASRQSYPWDKWQDSRDVGGQAPVPGLELARFGFCSSSWDGTPPASCSPSDPGWRCSTADGDPRPWVVAHCPVPGEELPELGCSGSCTWPSWTVDPLPVRPAGAADFHSRRRRSSPPPLCWSWWADAAGDGAAGSDVDDGSPGLVAAAVLVVLLVLVVAGGVDAGGSVAGGGAVVLTWAGRDVGGSASRDAADDVSDIRDVCWVP